MPAPKTRPPRKVALAILHEWSDGEDYASALIDEASRDLKLPSRDIGLVQTLVLGTLRHLTLLDHWASMLTEGKELDDTARWAVRMGLVQLLVLDMQPHAAVNETVEYAGRAGPLVNAVLRRCLRDKDQLLAERDAAPMHIRYSHPEWLVKRWIAQRDAAFAEAMCRWNQEPAPIFARLNTLIAKRPSFEHEGEVAPGFYKVSQVPRAALLAGECYIQDPSTAMAPQLLDPSPSHSVLDACAAPGGKTVLLSQLMRNDGRIIATDNAKARVDRLTENIERMGATNASPMMHDWIKTPEGPLMNKRYERVLLDVPCTNTGVMRRRVDVRWRLKPEDFATLAESQFQLLLKTARTLTSKGVLVYSTCSIDRDENDAVVERALRSLPGLRLLAQKQMLPTVEGFDGAFAAALMRP